ncbi:MAG: AAA family ATPase [Chloroflexota bacterium]|nr:AAA family ATPase [Chloroflexota bacterium]
MEQLKLFLFGPPRLERGGELVEVSLRKANALLSYLAITQQPHSRDTLAALLWPESDQRSARGNLRRTLYRLNKELGDEVLQATAETVEFNPTADVWLDVVAFQQHVTDCLPDNHPTPTLAQPCLDRLTKAVQLYSDDFLAGFTLPDCPEFDEWQFFEREGLRQTLGTVLVQLVHVYQARGEWEAAIEHARRWLALDTLHEPAHRQLMRLYALAGQQAAALRQYDECVRILDEELGVPPEEETTELYESIRTRSWPPKSKDHPIQRVAQEDTAHPSTPPPEPQPLHHNLPPQPTVFIGRERELDELDALLADPGARLITIVGPGGMGKTRLAVAAAERQLTRSRFPHGVYFVSLAPLSAPEHMLPAIAEALDVPLESDRLPSRAPEERLLDYLRQKRLLLVLDNCEHLLHGIELVMDVLRAAPDVQVLATSRERLRMRDEQVYPIQGLDYPDGEGAAISVDSDSLEHAAFDLFLQSARRIRPDFALESNDLPALARICQLVEGMPLGLELAASWVNMLPVTEIAAEIQNSLDLLETDLRDMPTRQRSIRAVFAASWQRLSEAEQDLFMQLSVFRGGFTRQAVLKVTGASLRLLSNLSDKSLLQYNRAHDRYQIHELLRQYATEKLAQEPTREHEVRDRHSIYYCAWLQDREPKLKDAQQEAAAAALEADIDNVQRAWEWAVHQRLIEPIQQAMDGLGYLYEWQGRIRSGQRAFHSAADRLSQRGAEGDSAMEERRVLGKVLAWQGLFTYLLGDVTLAEQLLQQSRALLDSHALHGLDTRLERAFVYAQLGLVAVARGQEQAWSWYEQSLTLFRALGCQWETSEVLARMGRWAHVLAEFQQAERLFNESLAIKRTLGDRRGIARVLGRLSQTAVEQGQLELAERLARESNAIYHELENVYGIAAGLRQLGVILLWCGKPNKAHRWFEQCLAHCQELGDRFLLGEVHPVLGLALSFLGQHDEGYAQAQVGLQLNREIGDLNQVAWSLWVVGWILVSMEAYAEAELALRESVDLYEQFSTESNEPRQLGWSRSLLGYVLWRRGDLSQAQKVLLDVLPTSIHLGDFLPLLTALPAIALMLAHQGQTERAVELYALVWRYPLVANPHGWLEVARGELASIAASLPPEITEAAKARGQPLDLWQTAEALLEELPEQGWPVK